MRPRSFASMLTKDDLGQIGKLAALSMISWLTPPRFWRAVAIATRTMGQTDHSQSLYQRVLGPEYSSEALATLGIARRACSREAKLQILGLNGPWRAWRPDVRLRGEAHLKRALDAGRGVVLWLTESAYSELMVKVALHQAGYRVCQLSRPTHGFSVTRFGIRYLNPICIRVEDRFLGERVVIIGDNTGPAMRTLRARIAANGVVSIVVRPEARRFAEVPFLCHRIRVPTGPIRLTQDTGAALLPVFAFASADGHFEVTIQEALQPIDKQDIPNTVAAAYARRLEPFVRAYPEQWAGWDWIEDAPSASTGKGQAGFAADGA
jgi:predicted LPLAT superfamily acyltransferase